MATLAIVDSATGNSALLYPSHADSGEAPFSMVGLGRSLTGRLNLVAVGGGAPDPSSLPPCAVDVGFVNEIGDPYRNASGMPIAAGGALTLDRAVYVDLKAADAFRGVSGPRVSFRPVVRILTPTPCQRPVPSLEWFDTSSGRGALRDAPLGVS